MALCYSVVFELTIFYGASIFCSLMDMDKRQPERAMFALNKLIYFCITIHLFHFFFKFNIVQINVQTIKLLFYSCKIAKKKLLRNVTCKNYLKNSL